MSSYVCFYVEKNGVYIPLTDYSRSNPMYKAAEYKVPYENGVKLDEKVYHAIKEELDEMIASYEKSLKRYEHDIEFTRKVEGISLNEKLDAVAEYTSYIEEVNEELDMTKAQLNVLNFMYHNIVKWNCGETNVWVGIEWNPNYKEED